MDKIKIWPRDEITFISEDGEGWSGTKRHSGRHHWGTGEHPYQHEPWFKGFGEGAQETVEFYDRAKNWKKQFATTAEAAKFFKMTDNEFRKELSFASNRVREMKRQKVSMLLEQNPEFTDVQIGKYLGISPSTVRNYRKEKESARTRKINQKIDELQKFVDENKYVDIGPGTEIGLGVTRSTLDTNIVAELEKKGYKRQQVWIEQLGTDGKSTNITVLTAPGVEYKELYENRFQIKNKAVNRAIDENGNSTFDNSPPVSVDMNRVQIVYTDENGKGGKERDGLIELRRGVPDLDLQKANYAQVRIAVDGKYYLKGMAVYADDLPPGVDIRFNSNKTADKPIEKVLKPMSSDPDNPFGAVIRGDDKLVRTSVYYTDPETGEKKKSALNIVNEEGNWGAWRQTLASQFLSKQDVGFMKQQLNMAYAAKAKELDDILALDNPTIKKKLLASYSDTLDAAAVDLAAAPAAGQTTNVILPFPEIQDGECYNPRYKPGTKLALIRYPHGGRFEIAIVTVNNNYDSVKKVMGNALDGIGINAKTAQRLSGADFDGDNVIAIPLNSRNKVKADDIELYDGLKDFDPEQYAIPKDYMGGGIAVGPKKGVKQPDGTVLPGDGFSKPMEMGKVTNLICDMTLMNAPPSDIARAVKYSMVVIDALKHQYDWRRAKADFNIPELYKKYQGRSTGGGITVISKASSKAVVPARKERTYIAPYDPEKGTGNTDPETGRKIWKPTGESYVNKEGKVIQKYTNSTKMYETEDAYTLVSPGKYEPEIVYADFANQCKALANEARKEYLKTPTLKYSKEARLKYDAEVKTLNAKIEKAMSNKPFERMAQLLGNERVALKIKDNPALKDDKEKLGKIKAQELDRARKLLGAKKERIQITDREWEAIQAGAISENKLLTILNNTDEDALKQRAMPRNSKGNRLSEAQKARIKAMLAQKVSSAIIAEQFGISVSTVNRYA